MNLGKYIKRHEYSADHLHCKDKSENFIAIAQGKKHDVVSMLSSAFTSKMEILRNFEEKKHFEGYHFCVVDKLLRL